jgi:hypothetical protein
MPERSRSSRFTVRDAARAVPEDFGRALEGADERLRDRLRRTPLLDNLADWRLVLLAGAVGLVVAGIARLAVAWLAAVAIFLLVFTTVMLVIAGRRTGD